MTCRKSVSNYWRRVTIALMLSTCGLCAVANVSPQGEPEDGARRIWNKIFREARDHASARRLGGTAVKRGLIGITIWRLRDDQDNPTAERATADTHFSEGERLRLSIEVPRSSDSYLYVIDREVYADGSTGAPYLIFPSQTTPEGGNVVKAGKPAFVPARGDEFPYFRLERVRKDQLSEELTIILSPTPLKLAPGTPSNPVRLEKAQVAQWEKRWGGRAERREDREKAGKELVAAERGADEGERRLVPGDPLPQTIYLTKVKPGAPMMLRVPLRIAP